MLFQTVVFDDASVFFLCGQFFWYYFIVSGKKTTDIHHSDSSYSLAYYIRLY